MNGGKPMHAGGYLSSSHAAASMAAYLDNIGVAPVRATYPDFDAAYQNLHTLTKSYGPVNAKDSVVDV